MEPRNVIGFDKIWVLKPHESHEIPLVMQRENECSNHSSTDSWLEISLVRSLLLIHMENPPI